MNVAAKLGHIMWETLNIFIATSLSSLSSSFLPSHIKSISIPVYTNSCVFPMMVYASWEKMKFNILLIQNTFAGWQLWTKHWPITWRYNKGYMEPSFISAP